MNLTLIQYTLKSVDTMAALELFTLESWADDTIDVLAKWYDILMTGMSKHFRRATKLKTV
jgi:hypothetical protein